MYVQAEVRQHDAASFNARVVENLREAAMLLQLQGADGYRVQAYRRAADTLESLGDDLRSLVRHGGVEVLTALPGIGRGIAAAIAEMVFYGRWSKLDRLRGQLDPAVVFQRIPGIGAGLARRIHEILHVDTLEALEAAAHDGRLATVPGIGHRREAAIRNALSAMLGRLRISSPTQARRPSVALLLEVDRRYREAAARGQLPLIAPKRFNPEGRRWLPVLHLHEHPWQFTALYSNTARAHETGHTHDWVVLYFYDEEHREGQCTVVTERRGPLAGRRVVRGRESECREHYGE